MSFLVKSRITRSTVVEHAKAMPSRLRRVDTAPARIATTAAGRYLDRLRWLFTGR